MTTIRPQLLPMFGVGLVLAATHELWWLVAAHATDPLVTVWSPVTLATYATEVFIQLDTVGAGATALAWVGLTLTVVGVAWPVVKPALGYGPVIEA